MRWFEKGLLGFDDPEWPKDSYLDPFRDAVWLLSSNGDTKAWVTTSISPMRSFPFFWLKFECMWLQVHWADGKHEGSEEDYSPWVSVEQLLAGHFTVLDSRFGRDGTFDSARVAGLERDRLWAQLGHGVVPSARS